MFWSSTSRLWGWGRQVSQSCDSFFGSFFHKGIIYVRTRHALDPCHVDNTFTFAPFAFPFSLLPAVVRAWQARRQIFRLVFPFFVREFPVSVLSRMGNYAWLWTEMLDRSFRMISLTAKGEREKKTIRIHDLHVEWSRRAECVHVQYNVAWNICKGFWKHTF